MMLKNNHFCIQCGSPLIKQLDNEKSLVPFCQTCQTFQYDPFNVAVSMILLNPKRDKVLLVKQYGLENFRLVAGYINKGDNATECIKKELYEELKLDSLEMRYNDTAYFEPSNTLMINYIVTLNSEEVECNEEIDEAVWMTFDQACKIIKPNSLAELFLRKFLLEEQHGNR